MSKASKQKVLNRVADLFRSRGFDGTSVAEICKATGLVKASIYHRFPGGKEGMAEAVLAGVEAEFGDYVLAPLGESGDLRRRIAEVGRRLRGFYRDGTSNCALESLTFATHGSPVRRARRTMKVWIDSFTKAAREAGLPPATARTRAEDAIAAVEGALIVARVQGDRHPFLRAVASLPERLTQ